MQSPRPRGAGPFRTLGRVGTRMNRIIENLESALHAGEDTAPVRFDLGSAYFEERNWNEAVAHLQAAVNHDPGYVLAWKLLGQAHQVLGRTAQAREAFENGFGAAEKYGDIEMANAFRALLTRLDEGS